MRENRRRLRAGIQESRPNRPPLSGDTHFGLQHRSSELNELLRSASDNRANVAGFRQNQRLELLGRTGATSRNKRQTHARPTSRDAEALAVPNRSHRHDAHAWPSGRSRKTGPHRHCRPELFTAVARAFSREYFPATWRLLDRDARHPDRDSDAQIARLAAPIGGGLPAAQRPRARDWSNWLGQELDPSLDHRHYQREKAVPHRHDRRPNRVSPFTQALDDQSTRSRSRHARLSVRATRHAAPGAESDSDRRDARLRNDGNRSGSRRDRTPRAFDAAHDRRLEDRRSDHRSLSEERRASHQNASGANVPLHRLATIDSESRRHGPHCGSGDFAFEPAHTRVHRSR